MEFSHKSVLLKECIENLAIKPNGTYVDATLGGAGHSREILVKNSPKGLLIGIDRDPASISVARERLSSYSDRIELFNTTYDHITKCVTDSGAKTVDGVLMDLGVSSFQIGDESRGFSFMKNGPLDMRMGSSELSAATILNTYSETDIEYILRVYSEEKASRRLARAIVNDREKKPFTTTHQLVELVMSVKGSPRKGKKGIHPATLTFQGLRIAVNDELGILERSLEQMYDLLSPGGRLVIITFHSLEDRIVKNYMNSLVTKEKKNKYANKSKQEIKKEKIKIITKKPIIPSKTEVVENPRARSAKLRVMEKQ